MSKSFRFCEIEARRMRRGVFLFPVVILPFAAILGLDASKSQPTHFLLIMGIGILVSLVLVGVSRAGVEAQIQAAAKTTLTVLTDKLLWSGPIGQTELPFGIVDLVIVQKWRGNVRSILLEQNDGKRTRLAGYERMDELAAMLVQHLRSATFRYRNWSPFG